MRLLNHVGLIFQATPSSSFSFGSSIATVVPLPVVIAATADALARAFLSRLPNDQKQVWIQRLLPFHFLVAHAPILLLSFLLLFQFWAVASARCFIGRGWVGAVFWGVPLDHPRLVVRPIRSAAAGVVRFTPRRHSLESFRLVLFSVCKRIKYSSPQSMRLLSIRRTQKAHKKASFVAADKK